LALRTPAGLAIVDLRTRAGTLVLSAVCFAASCEIESPAEPNPPDLEDILLNGTTLTKVVRDGLPAGATTALEFTLTGAGAIRN
jgi:hypothetical protein